MTAEQLSAPAAALEVDGLTVQFGGLVAVDDVTLQCPSGAITGLIGPNGAGKSTTFNACTGLVTPTRGTVGLNGRRLDGHSSARRAQWGLGRTFQRMALFDTMTVEENVRMGLECRQAGRGFFGQLWAVPRERTEAHETARSAMARCSIEHLAATTVGDLSTGQRRLVELARVLAGRFEFLLLDEPSSGLDESETGAFARILTDTVAAEGIGILLVEHDMALVRGVCSYAYVLDFGKLIHEGPTAEVLDSDIVRAAYLGSEEVD